MKHNLSSMSREEKLRLLAAHEEKARRNLKQKQVFQPTQGQRLVIMSEALERFLFCGNGFGKSTILVNEVYWAATGYNPFKNIKTPVPAKILLVLDDPAKVEDFITEYRKWHPLEAEQLHKRGKPHYSFITYDTGSSVTVITHQVEPLKLEGSQWTHIFLDEPPPKPVFTAVFRGGRIKGRPCRILLAGTPVTAAWMRTDIHEPWSRGELPDVECFQGSTDENRANLDEGWFKRFFGRLSEHESEIRRKGAFHDLEGLALAHLFEESIHVIDRTTNPPDPDWPCVVAIDPHPSKKHYAVLLAVDRDNRLYVVKELAHKLVAREFAKQLKTWMAGFRVIDIVCDSLGSADSTSGEGFKSFIKVLNEEGVGARATTYEEKQDEAFISRIQDSLLIPSEPDNFGQFVPKLRLYRDCTMSISDIRNVQWVRDRAHEMNKPKLDISNKDALACLKYALACNLFFDKISKARPHHVTRTLYGIKRPHAKIGLRTRGASNTPSNDDEW